MLVKVSRNRLAHIRKPGTEETWCGKPVSLSGSTKGCELCDECLDTITQAEQGKPAAVR